MYTFFFFFPIKPMLAFCVTNRVAPVAKQGAGCSASDAAETLLVLVLCCCEMQSWCLLSLGAERVGSGEHELGGWGLIFFSWKKKHSMCLSRAWREWLGELGRGGNCITRWFGCCTLVLTLCAGLCGQGRWHSKHCRGKPVSMQSTERF